MNEKIAGMYLAFIHGKSIHLYPQQDDLLRSCMCGTARRESTMRSVWRYEDGRIPNLLALAYAFIGYTSGFFMIAADSLWLIMAGTLLLAHAMVIAAYLVHECAHNTLFAQNKHNAMLGEILNWLTGACYAEYESIRHKHFRHHVDRADVVVFDYRKKLGQYPNIVKVIRVLEWLYIPAVQVMMHALVIVLPFVLKSRKQSRKRVAIVLAARILYFTAITILVPRIIWLYPLAYVLFLNVMRFMDTHQHTYEIFEMLDQERGPGAQQFDGDYEVRNTFSNLFSVKHPWLNLLVLNFGYHNAHHDRPTTPWYRLPKLHRQIYGEDSTQVLPFGNLIKAFHQYRIPRILNEDEGDIEVSADRGKHFIGVDGVSFLTTV